MEFKTGGDKMGDK